jgi:hypothetical protein
LINMEWLKKKWDLAGLVALISCGVLRVFGPDQLAGWTGWTAVVFAALILGKVIYDRSARLQAMLGTVGRIAGVEPASTDEPALAFRGLLPFREGDAPVFGKLGRRNDVASLLPAVRDPGLRVVVLRGDSGCGKTSLIRAGLLPTLRAEGWQLVDVDPETRDPGPEIQRAKAAAPSANLLVVADQFEERYLRGEQAAVKPFNEALRNSIENKQAKWLIGVRADFKYLVDDLIEEYGHGFEAEFLKPRVGYGLRLFTVAGAEAVIAELGKGVFEPGVALQLAEDLSRGGRVLPADMQFVGFEMQQRGIQTLDEYRKAGGRDGIIADSISGIIAQFTDEHGRQNARKLLNALIDQEHGTRLPEALTAQELGARAGVVGDVESFCEPFVKQRLVLRVGDSAANLVARYRLAHDYLVQPIYTAIGHTETDYEKVIRLLTLYAGEFGRNPQARIPHYDYRLIRRILRRVFRDARLNESERLATPVLRATARRNWRQRGGIAVIAVGVGLFLPPVRTRIESAVTRQLNAGITASRPQARPQLVRLSSQEVVGVPASLFRYGRMPFLRRIPIPEMVLLPRPEVSARVLSGGRNAEVPAGSVAVARFKVTVAQFNAFAAVSGRPEKGGDPDLPVVAISWDEAKDYCTWLREITGKPFRLPTGAEWEAVCRAGGTDRQVAASLSEVAWHFDNAEGARHPVGRKKPNSFGLFDMLGNVEEWVADWDEDWLLRSTRGGNFNNKGSEMSCTKAIARSQRDSIDAVGFRCFVDTRQ